MDLTPEQRHAVYDIYEGYAERLLATKSWDDADRVLWLLHSFRKHGDSNACFRDSIFPIDKLYADEVQDSTQCGELGLTRAQRPRRRAAAAPPRRRRAASSSMAPSLTHPSLCSHQRSR